MERSGSLRPLMSRCSEACRVTEGGALCGSVCSGAQAQFMATRWSTPPAAAAAHQQGLVVAGGLLLLAIGPRALAQLGDEAGPGGACPTGVLVHHPHSGGDARQPRQARQRPGPSAPRCRRLLLERRPQLVDVPAPARHSCWEGAGRLWERWQHAAPINSGAAVPCEPCSAAAASRRQAAAPLGLGLLLSRACCATPKRLHPIVVVVYSP